MKPDIQLDTGNYKRPDIRQNPSLLRSKYTEPKYQNTEKCILFFNQKYNALNTCATKEKRTFFM